MHISQPIAWLCVSVVVNAVLTGVLVGGALAHSRSLAHNWPQQHGGRGKPPRSAPMHKIVPAGTRRALRRDLAAAWRDAVTEREALNAARDAFVAAAHREPLDEAEMKSILGDLRRARAALGERTEDVVMDHIADLPPRERGKLLRVIESLPHGPRHGRRRDDHN